MNILIVGAGAVGQVYGLHLQRAGHQVSFFVKEKYVHQIPAQLELFRLGYFKTKQLHLLPNQIISAIDEVSATAWDQIWFSLSSDALRGELATQVMAASGQATVVCLQPDMEDSQYVSQHLPDPSHMVQGLITFIAYQSPLPQHTGPKGIAYFIPPLSPGVFAGESDRAHSVVNALKQGGMDARIVPDFAKAAAAAPAIMQPLIAALEVNQWQLASLKNNGYLALGLKAAQQAVQVVQAKTGAHVIGLRWILAVKLWQLILPLSQLVLPLALEDYLHYHFSKVGQQTRLMLDTYIRLGEQHQLDISALQQLRQQLPELPQP